MRLLVIGGNGHYANLITRHLSTMHQVTIFDLHERACDFECDQVVGDIMKLDQIDRATRGADTIITFFLGDAMVSTIGMTNVMTAAEQNDVTHVVYTSSGGMPFPINTYHSNRPLFPFDSFSEAFWKKYFPMIEDAGMFPGEEATDYFLYKWICEKIGKLFTARGKVKFTSIRPGLLMHDDMTNHRESETTRHHEPFYMLMTGHVRMCDCAHMYNLAIKNPPAGFEAYHCSNDTPYNNLSVEKARDQLGYACLDRQPYIDFYASMDWGGAFAELAGKGFSENLLRSMHGFRHC